MILASAALIPSLTVLVWPFKPGTSKTPGAIGSNHRLADHAPQQSNAQAEVVINTIDEGVIAVNGKGNITLINPAATKLIGWTNGDALALNYRSVLQLVDAKDQPITDASDPILSTLNTNTPTETEHFSLVTGSGKRRLVALVISPFAEIGTGAIIVFRDITKSKAEEREQAEFISTASHEMRTPVASIEGYLGLALNPNTAQVDQRAHDYIGKAHEAAQHLGRLFQDLLDVSKADDGRLTNHPKVVDVVAYTGDIVEGLQQKASEKSLVLKYVPTPSTEKGGPKMVAPIYYANVDNDHLREVVANLVENAIKYTPQGQVTVDVSGDDQHVTVSVQDSGIGIPAEDIPHLFQKFYRVDNSDTREIGGTGLGLYLCRRLAEVMGGRIDLTSEFKKGSTFMLSIPRLERAEALRLQEQQRRDEGSTAVTQPPLPPAPAVIAPPQPVAPPPAPPVAPAVASTPAVAPQPAPTAPVVSAAPSVPVASAAPRPVTPVQIPDRQAPGQNQGAV